MLVPKIRLLSTQPSGQALLDLRQQEKSSCFPNQCQHLTTCHQPSTSEVWYSSTKTTSTHHVTRRKGPIRSMSETSRSIYLWVKFLFNNIAGTVLILTVQRIKSTLCKTVTSIWHLNIGRLSTPSDQRPAHLNVLMRDQKPYTLLR